MNRIACLILGMALLGGCGKAPVQPHIYVIGVDASSSIWSIGRASTQQFANLPQSAAQSISYRVRDILNEMSIAVGSRNFITTTRVEPGSVNVRKTVGRAGLQKEIDNAVEMVTALGSASGEERKYAITALRKHTAAIKVMLGKRNYQPLAGKSDTEILNEDINPASAQRIQQFLNRINGELDRFTSTVTVAVKPEQLRSKQRNILDMLTQFSERLQLKNNEPLDPRWKESKVYGNIETMNTPLFFLIGDQESTNFKPEASELDASLGAMVAAAINASPRAFAQSTDYRLFFQRSMNELANLVSTWGDFDRDIGVRITYIIIGDGRHDPKGESSGVYQVEQLNELKDLFAHKKDSDPFIAGLPWDAVSEINIELCVPQKNYNSDTLNAWAKLAQEVSTDGKVVVHYHMLEQLKEKNGLISEKALTRLLD